MQQNTDLYSSTQRKHTKHMYVDRTSLYTDQHRPSAKLFSDGGAHACAPRVCWCYVVSIKKMHAAEGQIEMKKSLFVSCISSLASQWTLS